jgi:hypothetical protein
MQPLPSRNSSAAPASERDQRQSERFGVGLPYTLGNVEGYTRDLSAGGLSFESETDYPVGSIVKLTVRYGLDGHNFLLPCEVEVVRVVREGERFTVAARLCRPFFDPAS